MLKKYDGVDILFTDDTVVCFVKYDNGHDSHYVEIQIPDSEYQARNIIADLGGISQEENNTLNQKEWDTQKKINEIEKQQSELKTLRHLKKKYPKI